MGSWNRVRARDGLGFDWEGKEGGGGTCLSDNYCTNAETPSSLGRRAGYIAGHWRDQATHLVEATSGVSRQHFLSADKSSS